MPTKVAGITFDDDYSLSEVAKVIASSKYEYVVTPNVDHVISYNDADDRRYKSAIEKASIALCDSKVLRILSCFFSKKAITHVVPGSDLTEYLLSHHGHHLGRVGIVGGSEGDLYLLGQSYSCAFDFQWIPSFGFIDSQSEVERLTDTILKDSADTIFVCVGSPQQEIFASKLLDRGARARILCVGASFDFILGRETRAPKWIQSLSLEWMHRLISSPRRMASRYLIRDVKILKILLAEWLNAND